ncbi:nuclear transport factor 2 family protein [Porcipelethomonas ammoniilytica]|uniref:nuclear transport factor 2 family protein n=1 Tax=Porcipelethomonas ammoniilytica TaxID=2981722 RepID=UPI00082222E2|nr:nuclear transport factor 2 family protein [Porcipelethomonas ammoniilytica]MCU6720424.1 nuclear transport factor 2 family protein [Porcipelethomonas ammoniilytica]SCJ12492.1 Uncharacterised protein [uncultured Ruminococcus sp.]
MNKQEVLKWIESFVSAWRECDFTVIEELFTDVDEYWETPFSVPVSNWDNVKQLWSDIVFQKDIDLKVDILAIEENKVTLHWYTKYQDSRDKNIYEMDGTYFLVFNENKKCIYFKQWWVMKE